MQLMQSATAACLAQTCLLHVSTDLMSADKVNLRLQHNAWDSEQELIVTDYSLLGWTDIVCRSIRESAYPNVACLLSLPNA